MTPTFRQPFDMLKLAVSKNIAAEMQKPFRMGKIRTGSPVWTRFELLPRESPFARTRGEALFSVWSARTANLYPCRAPILDTSRTRRWPPPPTEVGTKYRRR